MTNSTAVVIPTYNEKDNIKKLIEEIRKISLPIDILVVDDNSPDGTGDIVESLKKECAGLDIIHRQKKEGIGPAYINGFRHILGTGQYALIITMDADFSHDPKDISRFLEAARDADVVIGSRYVALGGVSDEWSRLRKYISVCGNIYARMVTGLRVMDCTAGFKCYRSEALKTLDFDKIFLNGYGFQIQMIYELNKKNFRIKEIPIFFDERKKGRSKMHINIVAEAFYSLIIMAAKDKFFNKKPIS